MCVFVIYCIIYKFNIYLNHLPCVYNIKHSFSFIIQLYLNIHYQSFLIMEKETERETKEMAKKL